jgi:hypothetical protein
MFTSALVKTVVVRGSLLLLPIFFAACNFSSDKSMKEPVIIDVFSGRPNPSWIPDEAACAILQQKLSRNNKVDCGPSPDGLGYKGFLLHMEPGDTGAVQSIRVFNGRLWYEGAAGQCYTDDHDLEKWLIAQAKQQGFAQLIKDIGL